MYKTAVIVSRDLEYGLSKIYQVAAADLPAKIGVFNNLEEAKTGDSIIDEKINSVIEDITKAL